jgi:hypothetical protein
MLKDKIEKKNISLEQGKKKQTQVNLNLIFKTHKREILNMDSINKLNF